MSGRLPPLDQSFAALLRRQLEHDDEEALNSAYELGRTALEQEFGVLEIVGALVRAMAAVANGGANGGAAAGANGGAAAVSPARCEAFLLEALSPFEMAHRGVREANLALRKMDEVREQEVRRVAHELHDSAGQVFASVHMALADLGGRVESDVAEEIDRVRVLLIHAEEQLRHLAHEFRPAVLDDLGLRAALEQLAESVSLRARLGVAIVGELPAELPSPLEIALYRMVQEALANVVRHALATKVVVTLGHTPAALQCRIEDDGRGFDTGALVTRPRGSGMGLGGIRERVAAFGGSLDVCASPGRGTRLAIEIPLEAAHAGANPAR